MAALALALPASATLVLVSANVGGQPGNGSSGDPAFSGDGSYVAILTTATDLVGGSDGAVHVVRYSTKDKTYAFADLANDSTTKFANAPPANCEGCVAGSDDGRYVAFISAATNLVGTTTFGASQVYVRDMATNATKLVSQTPLGAAGNNDSGQVTRVSTQLAISGDGRYVTFSSVASDLVPGAGGGTFPLVYVRDMQASATIVASLTAGGAAADGQAFAGDISGDGRYVAFYSNAANLPLGNGTTSQIFVRDRDADGNGVLDESGSGKESTQVISAFSNGDTAVAGNDNSVLPVISDNGNFVAYPTLATNLFTDANPGGTDIALASRAAGTTAVVDVDSKGVQGAATANTRPAISIGGELVAFTSNSALGSTGDTNVDLPDVFVHDTRSGQTILGSADDNGLGGAGTSANAALTSNGARLAFFSNGTSFLTPASTSSQVWAQDLPFAAGTGSTADLSVTQVVDPNPVALNGTTTVTVTVSNKGPDAATNVVLQNELTGSVTFDHSAGTVSQGTGCTADLLSCSLGSIPAAGTATVTYTVTPTQMPFEGSPFLQLDASVSSDTADPDATNNSAADSVAVFVAGVASGVSITSSAPSSEAGAKEVAVANIPLEAIPNGSGSTASSPIASIPIASIDLSGIPIASIPIASIPIASIGFTPTSLSSAFGGVSLAQIPLRLAGGWQARLAANGIPDVPLQTTTLADALTRAPNLLTTPTSIKLGDVGIASSPIASIPIASIALGPSLLSNLPLLGRTGAAGLDDWCAQINLAGGSCANGPSLTGRTVMDETVAGAPIASIPIASIPIASIPIASIPIASIPIASIVVNSSPIASIPIASIVVA